MTPVYERLHTRILGCPERAEKLVDWSVKKAKPGQRFTEELAFGLTLHFVANEEQPKLYIHWNPAKNLKFISSLGTADRFISKSYGISLEQAGKDALLKIPGPGKLSIVLWDSQGNDFCRQKENDDVNYLVGMIKFSEDGPQFHTEVECQKELEVVTALSIVKAREEPQTLAKKLPEKKAPPQFSEEVKAYLYQDALLSEFLKQVRR